MNDGEHDETTLPEGEAPSREQGEGSNGVAVAAAAPPTDGAESLSTPEAESLSTPEAESLSTPEAEALSSPEAEAPSTADGAAEAVRSSADEDAPVAEAEAVPSAAVEVDAPVAESEHREVEAKFGLRDPEQVRKLMWDPQPFSDFRFGDSVARLYTDTYHDTDAYDLLRRGYALRVREQHGGDVPVVALKGLSVRGAGPVQDRFEFQGAVSGTAPASAPESWPVPVRAMVEYLAGRDAAVRPVCQIRQRRVERVVSGDSGAVAQMSVDEVAVVDPRSEQPSPSVAHFTELEAELAPGADMEVFRALVATLVQLDLEARPTSKLERGIAAVADRPAGKPQVTGVEPDMSMAEAGRLIWRRQLAAMALNEAGARQGDDIEYVHDMRVATRRARSAERIFGAYFEPRAIKPLLAGLKKTAARLGEVRDLDVALDKLATSGQADRQQPLEEAWRAERAVAVRRLVRWLDAGGYRRFLSELGHLANTPGLGARDTLSSDKAPLPHQVRHTFPEAIIERYAIVRAYETVIDQPGLPVTTLHMLRIDCKRLRYVLEPVTHLLGPTGDDMVKTLKRLQDVLGELNDAEVARTRLLALAARGEGGPNLAEYLELQEAEIGRWVAAVPDRWNSFVSPGYRSKLYEAVARI